MQVDCCKGKVHDFELFKRSKAYLYYDTETLLDLGYKGADKFIKKAILPYKASKKHPLTKEQKRFNRIHSSRRVIVENVIRRCKIFNIVKFKYRGKHKNYGLVWNVVAGLVNLKI